MGRVRQVLGRTILVIEDERPLKKFLRITLESQNYRVIEATRAAEGISQAASSTPDLIILDLGLPDADGVDVARRVREWSAIPIIVSPLVARSKTKSSRSTPAPTTTRVCRRPDASAGGSNQQRHR